jgi:metaxin
MQAYLRLAKVKFAVQDCPWGSFSPTGQVPALDTEGGDLIGSDNAESIATQFEGAKEIINHLQRRLTSNLDSHLSPAARADSLSFITLLETKLIPALLYTTWCEDEAYSKLTRIAMATGLPFPLTYWLPFSTRKGMRAQLGETTSSEDIYEGACRALDAVSARLVQAANDGFFFGDQPSTLDSYLFACLAYLRSAPVVHPDLRKKFESHSALVRYVDRVSAQVFSAPVPSAAQVEMKWSSWGARAGSTGSGGSGSRHRGGGASPSLGPELNYKGKLWLMGAAVSIIGYVLFSGQYFDVSYGFAGDLGEDEEGEELD